MRLSFCYPTPDMIRTGIRRLAAVVNGERELLETFSPRTATSSLARHKVIAPPPGIN